MKHIKVYESIENVEEGVFQAPLVVIAKDKQKILYTSGSGNVTISKQDFNSSQQEEIDESELIKLTSIVYGIDNQEITLLNQN